MQLGLIARCDQSGLSTQTWEYYRHLSPAKTLVIDVSGFADKAKNCNKYSHPDRYPDAQFFPGWSPSQKLIQEFADGLDVVLGAETLYGAGIYHTGVRTVLAPNWEFFDTVVRPSLWIPPTLWHYGQIPEPKRHLPNPIATDRFTVNTSTQATHFLHIVGRPAIHDRNGTQQLIDALPMIKSEVTVTIRCQDASYVHQLLGRSPRPPNVDLRIESGDTENYWDNYTTGDVLVMPRRYGGLCLPAQEAIGAGMPVIMSAVSPNETWLPAEWLVRADLTSRFMAKNPQIVEVYTTDVAALARKIDQFATGTEFYAEAKGRAMEIRQAMSWDALLPAYQEALAG